MNSLQFSQMLHLALKQFCNNVPARREISASFTGGKMGNRHLSVWIMLFSYSSTQRVCCFLEMLHLNNMKQTTVARTQELGSLCLLVHTLMLNVLGACINFISIFSCCWNVLILLMLIFLLFLKNKILILKSYHVFVRLRRNNFQRVTGTSVFSFPRPRRSSRGHRKSLNNSCIFFLIKKTRPL